MNSFTGNTSQKTPSPSPSSFNTYQFDFGIGSNRSTSKPLKDQKLNPNTAPTPSPSSSTWTRQPNKPSWTHQPAPASAPKSAGLSSPASMVGDIFGKSWSSTAPQASTLGIPKANPNLFGDLVGSALGQGKTNTNVPLKAAPSRNSYSMGNLSDSLPKSTVTTTNNSNNSNNPMKPSWGSADNLGNVYSFNQSSNKIGDQPMKSSSGTASNPKKDPFGSLLDFGSKNSGNPPISTATSSKSSGTGSVDSSFGDLQNVKSANFGIPTQKPQQIPQAKPSSYSSGDFQNAQMDDFAMPAQNFSSQQPSQAKGGPDPLDMLFTSSAENSSKVSGSQQFSEMNDWDVDSEFGGQDHSGTTELEGLPPPPVGVTASIAKSKGLDNYKQGQYADAIKWLSWAVVLVEKSGDSAATTEVLTCRASCYKEVGEYKKAVADCSKVLERDSENVSVLLQRALLYESTEKYRLGAEDLRMVLKIDPGNRLAKSTIHRLNKLAD